MNQAIALELAKRRAIAEAVDAIILAHFDREVNCHVHIRRKPVQDLVRGILGLKDSYQLRRTVTERMDALGFRPVQLHGRGFYKYAKLKGGADDHEKGAES